MNATMADASRQLNFRITEEEHERFERLAKHYGLSVPNLIRLLVRREEQDLHDAEQARWSRGEATWERDKVDLKWLADETGIMKLEIRPDDRTRTFSLVSPKFHPELQRSGLTRNEAIEALHSFPKTRLVQIDMRTRTVSVLVHGGLGIERRELPKHDTEEAEKPRKKSR